MFTTCIHNIYTNIIKNSKEICLESSPRIFHSISPQIQILLQILGSQTKTINILIIIRVVVVVILVVVSIICIKIVWAPHFYSKRWKRWKDVRKSTIRVCVWLQYIQSGVTLEDLGVSGVIVHKYRCYMIIHWVLHSWNLGVMSIWKSNSNYSSQWKFTTKITQRFI